MTRRFLGACGIAAAAALLSAPTVLKAADPAERTLQVQVEYTGSGKVDETHKMWAVLWDSPSFVQGGGVMPVALKPIEKKEGTATFTGVQKVPAYVSVAFDPTGSWDGQSGPPPAGTSLGLYTKDNKGTPEPIDIQDGKTVTVKVSFDDTIKMK